LQKVSTTAGFLSRSSSSHPGKTSKLSINIIVRHRIDLLHDALTALCALQRDDALFSNQFVPNVILDLLAANLPQDPIQELENRERKSDIIEHVTSLQYPSPG